MKCIALLTVFFVCILHFNVAKQSNVLVQLHSKDIHKLFTEDEIWGVEYKNATEDIVQVEVVIDEAKLINITTLNKDMIMRYDVVWDDVQVAIGKERERINNTMRWTSGMNPDEFFLDYRDWLQYEEFIANLVLNRFSDIAFMEFLPVQTIQGRFIPVVKLTTDPDGNDPDRTALYIQAELHAREWLANAATMYILNALAEGYNTDPEITDILNSLNIYIVPTVNIDGYIYTWTQERMWRKNRRNNGDGTFGVDLNRNYDGPAGTWCTVGASSNPSSNTYCGTEPYSEPETQGIREFIFNPSHNIGAVVDMHTSGPLILFPWAYTSDHVPQPFYDAYVTLSNDISNAIYNVHEVRYVPTQTLGQSAGTMRDFPFGISDESYKMFSFTWEGRGPGFDPPASNIIPAGQEQLAGMLTLARFVIDRE